MRFDEATSTIMKIHSEVAPGPDLGPSFTQFAEGLKWHVEPGG